MNVPEIKIIGPRQPWTASMPVRKQNVVKVAVTTFDGYLFVVEAATVKEAIAKVEAKGHPMMRFGIVKAS